MARRLSDLPASESKYFTKYQADTHQVKMGKPPKCKHFFERTKSLEAECKCGAGLFLEAEDEVKDGHIYRGNKLVI